MSGKKSSEYIGITVLFAALFLFGCAAMKVKKPAAEAPMPGGITQEKPEVVSPKPRVTKKKVLQDVLVFRDLPQIDLDNDGEKEIVAVYAIDPQSSGVKVIKVSNEDGKNIIFKKAFGTPHIEFEVIDGVPAITVRELNPSGGCEVKKIYYWDGKAFSLKTASE